MRLHLILSAHRGNEQAVVGLILWPILPDWFTFSIDRGPEGVDVHIGPILFGARTFTK